MCTFICTFYFMSPPEIFSWIILSLSLHYNKTVWHVLVNKMIVSLIISHTAVCFFAFLVTLQTRYDLSLFSIISIISEMKTRDLLHDHKLKGKCSSWNFTTDSIFFSIRFYILVSFYGNIFSPSCLSWKVLWIWWYIWNFLKIKSILN